MRRFNFHSRNSKGREGPPGGGGVVIIVGFPIITMIKQRSDYKHSQEESGSLS
jgi:hypothetical protein